MEQVWRLTLGGWSEQPPPTMEAGGKDCEEETLQTAFKKLRVDAESLSGAESVSDALTPRALARVGLDSASGAKTKLSNSKDTWHCCTRKTSRGTSSRSQRRRRSKSPILHPPRFTYCSSAASALAPPGGGLKQQRLAVSDPAADDVPVQAERRSSAVPGCGSPVLFGVSPSYETRVGGVGPSPEVATAAAPPRWEGGHSGEEKVSSDGASAPLRSDAADFRALSELHCAEGTQPPCGCSCDAATGSQDGGEHEAGSGCGCRQQGPGWNSVEVYSFTGLRSVQQVEGRTLSSSSAPSAASPLASGGSACAASPLASGSPRSCSEQARAYVDDITIEDLSGYMEYYLYIPKKMSHMAEMMYT
ncbi:oxidative stress-responsive serine-rich protein 1 isoform X1 [Poecilia formosa]|uniref:Oxidative stress-responsive serine-rich protein 1 n=2 Tax=Poecilia formosa TaxID=48698 RepID=A0A087Y9B0_POEFO|nr:PREDICTED: oxidative stress-responsive serine-rich protein 1 isoform X1 [Poecilia formosa]